MKDILDEFRNGRHEFEHGHLEGFEGDNPFGLFEKWMTEAVENEENEPNAFTLSTVGADNKPTSRIVYFKDLINGEFIWYTNYNSKKGKDIEANDRVSMLFFWPNASRQIRIEGVCSKVAPEISDAYFASRPHGSKIGAWASQQSDLLTDRSELDRRVIDLSEQYEDEVPRPEFWGGYGIKPDYFEFWQGRPSRLHDRLVFELENNNWVTKRLNP